MKCFKAYDVRGKIPEDLNEDIAYRIGRAYALVTSAQKVIVGYDIRHSSIPLTKALIQGLLDSGVNVFNIGLCGTEEVYFASFFYKMDGGIMVTASHNPMNYNGMKFVQKEAKPISGDTGLKTIAEYVEKNDFPKSKQQGKLESMQTRQDYIQHLLTYINLDNLKPLKIVVNPGNGGAGLVIDAIEKYLPFQFIKIDYAPDGSFPNGIPNPLLPERRENTIKAVKAHQADLGIAWDGDFDRCFFFDHEGNFIEGYYIVGLLAELFLQKYPQEKIIHDPRLTWNTIDIINKNNGIAIQSKTGHAFIKEKMRQENAIYGGEMSAHHYFRDFAYCDSGMIPWLMVTELLSIKNKPLQSAVQERITAFPCSGEINFKVASIEKIIEKILAEYNQGEIDYTDGISIAFASWRFNLRASNTEPVLRLNIETHNDQALLQEKIAELSAKIA